MSSSDAAERAMGLRERKNRQRRRAIVRAAAELTMEGGYGSATIAKIAERADVAPRTVSTWFPAKDEILFENIEDVLDRAARHLHEGPGDVVDRLEAWVADEVAHHPAADAEIARLRREAIEHDGELRARDRQHFERIQSEVAQAVARDIRGRPDDLGPQLFAGATMAFFWKLGSLALEDDPQDAEALFASGYTLLRDLLAAVVRGRP